MIEGKKEEKQKMEKMGLGLYIKRAKARKIIGYY